MKTLIVEDDFTSRLLLQSFLALYGECHIAVNGKEAVDAFRLAADCGSPYDLVCMDILMPEMDGNEAVKQVRALEEERGVLSSRGAKIVMTSAVTDPREVCESFKGLCDYYLFKPIDAGRLLGYLKEMRLV
jgi:two-component system chemotaxis response regulator CheY